MEAGNNMTGRCIWRLSTEGKMVWRGLERAVVIAFIARYLSRLVECGLLAIDLG
jgi:hypothetical protein